MRAPLAQARMQIAHTLDRELLAIDREEGLKRRGAGFVRADMKEKQ